MCAQIQNTQIKTQACFGTAKVNNQRFKAQTRSCSIEKTERVIYNVWGVITQRFRRFKGNK